MAEAPAADRIAHLLEAARVRAEVPGFVALASRGASVRVWTAGVRGLEGGAPCTRDTLFRIASLTKPMTGAAALMLVEDGVLGLDDAVDRWLPELAHRRVLRSLEGPLDDTVPAVRPITLRHLLTCRMGLGALFADAASPFAQRMAELDVAPGPTGFRHGPDTSLARLATLPLTHQPGTRWLYHTGLVVAGMLVARAAGTSLGAVLHERLFGPLGMKETGFTVPTTERHRLTTVHSVGPTGGLRRWEAGGDDIGLEAGGTALISTVDDLLAFGRMLLDGGVHQGRRRLGADSVRSMIADQLTAEQKAASPFVPGFWDRCGWGLGLAVVTTPDAVSATPGRFGCWGGYGTMFFVDPTSRTVALLFSQRMMQGADVTSLSDPFLAEVFEHQEKSIR